MSQKSPCFFRGAVWRKTQRFGKAKNVWGKTLLLSPNSFFNYSAPRLTDRLPHNWGKSINIRRNINIFADKTNICAV